MWGLFKGRKGEEERRDERLSAYLDGELSEAERARFENRLSQDPALRAELRAMHRTISLMRELPQVTAPRNFILSESMVKRERPVREARRAPSERQRRTWAAPLLTAATAVVSLLFVIVLAGDLLLAGVGGLASVPAPMRQEEAAPKIALEAAPTRGEPSEEIQMEKLDATEQPSPPPASAEPTAPLADERAREAPEEAAEQEEADVEATRAAQAPPGAGATPPPVGGGGVTEEAPMAAPTVPPTMTAMTALTPTIPAEAPVVSEEELGLVEPTPGELEATPASVVGEGRETGRLQLPSLPWGVVEVVLGLASLGLAFATIRAWRRRER